MNWLRDLVRSFVAVEHRYPECVPRRALLLCIDWHRTPYGLRWSIGTLNGWALFAWSPDCFGLYVGEWGKTQWRAHTKVTK